MAKKSDHKARKEKQRKERLRREKHERRNGSTTKKKKDASDVDFSPPRFEMERTLRQFSKISGVPSSESDDQAEAQELAYQAMEASDVTVAAELCREALRLDADCVDALLFHATLTAHTAEERVKEFSEAVAAGERALGEDAFENDRGHFWGLTETRPYMRARHNLAEALWATGRCSDAIGHLEAMLDLNPNDNQGLRYVLVGWQLAESRHEDARRTLDAHAGDRFAGFLWAEVLQRFLAEDQDGALEALASAREHAANVEPYLIGKRRLPSSLPDYYSPGDESEAIHAAAMLLEAWTRNSTAIFWLRQQA